MEGLITERMKVSVASGDETIGVFNSILETSIKVNLSLARIVCGICEGEITVRKGF